MGLDDILRGAVKTAKAVTKDLQPTVLHAAWKEQTTSGAQTYKAAVKRGAIVSFHQQQVRTPEGELTMSRAQITFLEPVAISTKDKLTLSDGSTGPILQIGGPVDPGNDLGFVTDVWLG